MFKRFASAACMVAVVLLGAAHAAHAAIVPITQTELLNIAHAGFGGGAVTSVTVDGTDSVIITGTLSADQGGFTRFVPQDADWQGQGTFDWSGFTSFDITLTVLTANIGGAQEYVQSGSSFENFVQGSFTNLTLNNPVTFSFPLGTMPAPTLIQQWGFQVFSGTANAGQTASIRMTVVPVPEPGALCVLGLGGMLLAARRRRTA